MEPILMLVNSRQIVKEVNNTTPLDEALSLVVQRVKSSMDSEADSYQLLHNALNAAGLNVLIGVN